MIQRLKDVHRWITLIGAMALLALLLMVVKRALADISPEYLKNGRTYDQESAYIQWTGSVSYVSLYHRDQTSLPPSEGGGSCREGCTEQVTRIQSGSSVSGNFTYLATFNVQVASTGDPAVGTATIRACGQTIWTQNLYSAGAASAGFNNFPSPAWNVPTAGDCTWSISASGGYVDFRAVTTSYRTTPAPTVDLKVNGSDGLLILGEPASYTLSWTSTNAVACSASNSWSGDQATHGSLFYSHVGSGSYTYALTCTNPSGSAGETVMVDVLPAPTVRVTAPASLTEPASYTATWSSTSAVSCTGSDRFSGLSGLSGSKAETVLPAGAYDYTVTCTNAAGVSVSDTRRTTVHAAPAVDLKVDGSEGPTVTRTGPLSYTANWTSANATKCNGSSRLAGYTGISGARSESNVPAGTTYDYTVTCQNPAGASVRDTVRMVVVAAPKVDVKVNGLDGPLTFFAPVGYTVTWSSVNAASCVALNNLPDPITTSGSMSFSNMIQGVYRYAVQCANTTGTTALDSVVVNVNPQLPVVALKIDGGNGPITRISPAYYTLSWTSQDAVSCIAGSSDGSWSGGVSNSGTLAFTGVSTGVHTYTLTCANVSGTASDSVTATVIAPLSGTISPAYAKLLLFAPDLGQPAQTLTGSVTGGEPPYSLAVHVRAPSGLEATYTRSGSSWSLGPTDAGNPDFGTTEKGSWTAWAEIIDSAGGTVRTPSVTWDVSWYPVHGRP